MASDPGRRDLPLERLYRLDERVVPRLQRGARATARGLGAPFRAAARWEGRLGDGAVLGALWRHRQLLLLAAAVVVFAGSYVHFQRYPQLYGSTTDGDPVAAPTATGGTETARPDGEVTTVAPPRQGELASYLRERRQALAAADGDEERIAVVSLGDYLTGEEAAAVLEGVEVLELRLRVPAEEQDPFAAEVGDEAIPDVVAAAVRDVRDEVASEEEQIRELLESGTVDDPEYEEFYRAELDRLAAIRSLIDSGAATVYGAVVRGTVADLRAVAARDGVRLVDPAPGGVDPDASVFEAILPERGDRPPP